MSGGNGRDRIVGFVGGFHLTGAVFEPIIEPTVAAFADFGVERLVPGHCTGWKGTHRLAQAMPEAFVQPLSAPPCGSDPSGAGLPPPVYVIGTEVPVPGGEASLETGLAVTTPAAAAHTLEIHRRAFLEPDLAAAWERVVAMVVQPGVDFDHSSVHDYAPHAARALSAFVETQPRIVYEAHSTDYQTEDALHALVRDHFAILKVGPAATFALREALFALAAIEAELLPPDRCSQLVAVLDRCMVERPKHWQSHYHGDERQLRLLRRYALSDRCRYYWGEPDVQAAVETLLRNLRRTPAPRTLLSQYLPEQQREIEAGRLSADPEALVRHKVFLRLAEYARACGGHDAAVENETREAAALSER